MIPDPQTLVLFVTATLTLAPGPGVLYIVARSAEGGARRASPPPWV